MAAAGGIVAIVEVRAPRTARTGGRALASAGTYDRAMAGPDPHLLEVGTKVEVRSGFDHSWQPGFVVDDASPSGYVLRRQLDDALLPEIPHDRVRRERKRETWWV